MPRADIDVRVDTRGLDRAFAVLEPKRAKQVAMKAVNQTAQVGCKGPGGCLASRSLAYLEERSVIEYLLEEHEG